MPSPPRRSLPARLALWIPLLIAVATTSCSDLPTAEQAERAAPDAPPPPLAAAAPVDLAARALAANCFQCPGTDGFAGELKIAGESKSEIISELNEMRAENPARNIMNLHALAYTTAEIALIADYFSRQGR